MGALLIQWWGYHESGGITISGGNMRKERGVAQVVHASKEFAQTCRDIVVKEASADPWWDYDEIAPAAAGCARLE